MIIENPSFSPKKEENENSTENQEVNKFQECLKEIDAQLRLINAVGDELDKESKMKALEIIEKLKITTNPEEIKNSISSLKIQIGLIDVWKGDQQDKASKIKAQDLAEKLKEIYSDQAI